MERMRVKKRNGSYEDVSFDKILTRIRSLSQGPEFDEQLTIDETLVAQKVVQEIYDGVETSELDELSSQIAIAMYSKNPDFKILAGRIVMSNHHKNTESSFWKKIQRLYNYEHNNIRKPLIADYLYEIVRDNYLRIEDEIDYRRDYKYDFFGCKTLEKSYLYKIDNEIIERPQDMLMRVSLSIHRDNLEDAFENYRLMSNHYFTHATPTLFNAGSRREQFASCFLLSMKDDSVTGIYDTLKDCALISKHAGGIGLSIHDIRASNSYISGTNGYSNGLVPMLRVYNDTARYIDQGGNKRNGSFAIYLEPWHADIFEFLELKKNHGNELERARDLFYALWIPDLFMKRVKEDGMWSLMCPHECPGLSDCHSEEFVTLYESYEVDQRYRKQIKAREIWQAILTSQIETGTPYLLYKDACNSKSNQKNLGTIKSSNLCTEIVEYTSKDETAVCNLASISLKKFVIPKKTTTSFTVYSKDQCEDCEIAKSLLKAKGFTYEDIRLSEKSDRLALYQKIDRVEDEVVDSMPQIYDGSTYIGGLYELRQYMRPTYDFRGLEEIAGHLVKNLNHIIDYNYYPIPETKVSNMKHRPIGIGVQGFANVLFEMGYPFDSPEAQALNKDIFESIYYGSMKMSLTLAKERSLKMRELQALYDKVEEQPNAPTSKEVRLAIDDYHKQLKPLKQELMRNECVGAYSSFIGSPLHKGFFQFDMWNNGHTKTSGRHDWDALRKEIQIYGVRNSLLVAPMPTASTAQILGNYECFEPIMSNVYTRRVLAGEYMVINDYLVRDLQTLGLWTPALKDKIIECDGSVQTLEIPQNLKDLYKTVWELKQKCIVDMAVDRGHFICQSQSLNLFLESPDISTLTSMHFYGWKQGLKTGIYYLRSRPSSKAIQFTLEGTSTSQEPCENCSG
jgi:ribonucleoside-diphosphate reductase subunit M1